MENPRTLLTASILSFALLMGAGTFGVLTYVDMQSATVASVREIAGPKVWPKPPAPAPVRAITAAHAFDGVTHIVSGEVLLDDACELLELHAVSHNTTPPSATLEFETLLETDTAECGPAEAATPFSAALESAEDTIITASWNGEEAILSLIKH